MKALKKEGKRKKNEPHIKELPHSPGEGAHQGDSRDKAYLEQREKERDNHYQYLRSLFLYKSFKCRRTCFFTSGPPLATTPHSTLPSTCLTLQPHHQYTYPASHPLLPSTSLALPPHRITTPPALPPITHYPPP